MLIVINTHSVSDHLIIALQHLLNLFTFLKAVFIFALRVCGRWYLTWFP